jgi:hypothetical protein
MVVVAVVIDVVVVDVVVVDVVVVVVAVEVVVGGGGVSGSKQSAALCDFNDESTSDASGVWAMHVRLGRMYLAVLMAPSC